MFSKKIKWRELENWSKIFFESNAAILENDAWDVHIVNQDGGFFNFDADLHGIVIEPKTSRFYAVVACRRADPTHFTLAVYRDKTTAQFAAESLIRAGRAGEKIFVMPRGDVGILEFADADSKYLYNELPDAKRGDEPF